ncbi:hypothetical protein U1Q18_032654 [Sarracenia purpurea var. burkii]
MAEDSGDTVLSSFKKVQVNNMLAVGSVEISTRRAPVFPILLFCGRFPFQHFNWAESVFEGVGRYDRPAAAALSGGGSMAGVERILLLELCFLVADFRQFGMLSSSYRAFISVCCTEISGLLPLVWFSVFFLGNR